MEAGWNFTEYPLRSSPLALVNPIPQGSRWAPGPSSEGRGGEGALPPPPSRDGRRAPLHLSRRPAEGRREPPPPPL